MAATTPVTPTLEWRGDHLRIIDQTQLPARLELLRLRTVDDVVDAIQRLAVRGAPAIGICGAYGIPIGLLASAPRDLADARAEVEESARRIATARPTAVNLEWAVAEVVKAVDGATTAGQVLERSLAQARRLEADDRASCRRIGEHGRQELAGRRRILTHCNAGRLATAGWGTALGVVYAKAEAGEAVEVVATETRPLLQGARLTAWELAEAGIPVTLIADGAVASTLDAGRVEAVVVGCDRVAANGDTANKIGTLACALAARAAGVPFYVAGPLSTFDATTASGRDIVIELRHPDEVLRVGSVPVAAAVKAWNPAFDVTPADLVTAFITDAGVIRPPFGENIRQALEGLLPTGAADPFSAER